MEEFKSKHLKYEYKWTNTNNDDPKITGEPDRTLFNRQEGYEMLYLLNKIKDENPSFGITYLQKIEEEIKENLPGDVRAQRDVINWVLDEVAP